MAWGCSTENALTIASTRFETRVPFLRVVLVQRSVPSVKLVANIRAGFKRVTLVVSVFSLILV